MPGEPSTVPGLDKDAILIFCHSFKNLLARVDEETGIDFAALAYSNTNVPQQVLNTFATVIAQAGNGTDHFIQNYLPTLLDLRNRLENATASAALPQHNPPAVRKRLSSLDRLINERIEQADSVAEQSSDLQAAVEATRAAAAEAEQHTESLKKLTEEIEALKDKAKYIVEDDDNPDEPSISTIYDQVNARRSATEGEFKKIEEAVKRANKAAATAEQLKGNTEALRKEAQGVLDQAKAAMRGATQAGLAESFISERDKKMIGLAVYGTALAIAVVGAIIFAVKEVLPAVDLLTNAVAARTNNIGALTTGLLIRSVLLAPFVFLGWFAALQYRRIDLLRIDYAAKAAAAKAYVGYKDEMKGDPKLISALKAHLIQRFGEHPVRLVTKDHDENVPLELFGLSTAKAPSATKGDTGTADEPSA